MSNNYKLNKTLKSYTIVPAELYVKRYADFQLEKIIEDKGRPGYVLVARQMGKTNLLLNAKREYSNETNCFLYLDISNTFPTIASFYRNIIDTALESYHERFINAKQRILISRQSDLFNGLPHKEHEQEIRYLLNDIKGDLIICLDEVDALIKTAYSDQVFSYIRSIYFSGRVNFPELHRLNYVLSGVADPSELIKDKSASPFNIGEKIYLNDFSNDEFLQFLEKAKINLDNPSKERIFYWANGNPRITWDICSAVEELILDNKQITSDVIDALVNSLYLIKYDLPPIDHIRTLAEDDREVRSGLISIQYDKSDAISSQIKNKLYLSGIVSYSEDGGKVSIKNRVIASALSEQWLKEIEESKLSLLEQANNKLESHEYAMAHQLFQEYIDSLIGAVPTPEYIFYQMGWCCRKLGRYEEAVEHYIRVPYKLSSQPTLYLLEQYNLGLCYFYLNNFESSRASFYSVLHGSETTNVFTYYYDSCVTISSILLASLEKDADEIIRLSSKVINDERNLAGSTDTAVNFKRATLLSYHNIALAYDFKGDKVNAIECFEKAISISDVNDRVGLSLSQISTELSLNTPAQLLNNLIEYITENSLVINPENPENRFLFTSEVAVQIVELLEKNRLDTLLDSFIQYLSKPGVHTDDKGLSTILASVFVNQLIKTQIHSAHRIASRVLDLSGEFRDVSVRRMVFSYALILQGEKVATINEEAYFNEFLVMDSEAQLGDIDYRILHDYIVKHAKHKHHSDFLDLLKRFKEIELKTKSGVIDSKSELKSLIIDYLEFFLYRDLDILHATNMAIQLDKQLQSFKIGQIPFFPENFISALHSVVSKFLLLNFRPKPVLRMGKKIGRNDLVRVLFGDGSIEVGKHKYFEDRINTGECKIIQ